MFLFRHLDLLSERLVFLHLETWLGLSPRAAQPKTGLTAMLLVILIPSLIALFILIRFVFRHTIGEKMKTTLLEDYQKEAEGFEKSGRYVAAANVYESKLRDPKTAAPLYEKGGDFRKAAELYDLLGEGSKAKEMYEKDGNIEGAAGVLIREGQFEDAAKLYDKAGNKIEAALLMERAGRRLAAVRAYREAGDYINAARLLDEEGMTKEAAEMFGLFLRDKDPDASNVQDFYTYGFKLEKAGETEKALEVYRKIDETDPAYKDVRERLQSLSPAVEKKEDLEGKTTIRSFIRSGSMDPKNSLKLWLHILKSLQDVYRTGRPCGLLSPENIMVDSNNRISFLAKNPSSSYAAPEKDRGLEPDVCSDVYSMGVILYEMLTGGLDGLGSTRVAKLVQDLPDWLDEMVVRCLRKVREDRYQNIEEIFADIKTLSKGRKDSSHQP